MPKRTLIFILLFVSVAGTKAQSLTGSSGYFNIPSAEIYPDATIYAGGNYFDKNNMPFGNYKYPGVAAFVTMTFLPFMEGTIRFTRVVGPDVDHSSTVGDRMATARFRFLRERKYRPAMLVGFQNFFTTLSSGDASHFNSTYLVLTKNFKFRKVFHKIGVTAGYGIELFKSSDYQFIGLFGGAKFVFKKLEFLELMVEYDADQWNAGARITFFKHLILLGGIQGMKEFAGGVSYRFKLP